MKIETNILETHEAKLTVSVEPENFEESKKRAARQLAKKYKIPGFRPGKAPYTVVQKHLGDGAITEQAISILIDEVYPEAIKEANIQPYGPGSIEEMPSLDPPTFEFLIPLSPDVTLPDYRAIRIDFTQKQVEDQDVEQVIQNLRESQAAIAAVTRPIEESDMVYIVLSGERKGETDPEKKVLLEERRYPVIIEKEDNQEETEYPFPGFSRKLIGLKPGDQKKLQHKFSDDYEFEDLRGVTGIYQVKIEEVKGRSLPEVNDEFAKSVGNYENLEALHQEIQQSLAEQFETDQINQYNDQIIDQLVEQATIKYPPQMLEDEINDFIHDLEHQLSHQGITIDIYLKSRGIEMESLRKEVKDNAEARMKRGLILMEVSRSESISVPPQKIEERVSQTLTDVASYYSDEEAKRLSTGDNLQHLVNRIATDEIINRTMERLRDIAMGKEILEEVPTETGENTEIQESEEPHEIEAIAAEAVAETSDQTSGGDTTEDEQEK